MLTLRLQTILDILPTVDSVIDVGTDHCLLPIAIKQKYPHMNVAASDIAKGPLQSAQMQLQQHHMTDIELYLSNGLQNITKPYDCVIVAGMGANTMIEIMEDSFHYCKRCKYLILQANKDVDLLREWLFSHGFSIVNEAIVHDYKYYQILVVVNENQTYDEYDVMFGPILRYQRSDVFNAYWKEVLLKHQELLCSLPKGHKRIDEIQKQVDMIAKIVE